MRDFHNRWTLRHGSCDGKLAKTFYSFEAKKEIITRHRGGKTRCALTIEYGLLSEKLIKVCAGTVLRMITGYAQISLWSSTQAW